MEYNKEYAKKVYAGLSKRGYTEGDLGSEDLFVARMGKENNRRLLYDMIARRGDANVGSWERFNERMSVPDIDKSQYTFTERELGLGGYQLGQPIPIIEQMRRKETEAGAGTPMGDDIYRTKEGQYTRTEVPFRTIEYPSLGMAQMAARGQQREDTLAAYRSAYNRLEAPGEVDERTLIEWGNNMENAPIEQKNLYTRIMGQDATNRVDLDAVMRSYDEAKKSLEGVEDPEGLAVYLMMPDEQKAKLPEDERSRYEGLVKDKRKTDVVDDVNELHERISSLMEQQRVSDIKMHRDYLENRSTGQAIKDAILGIPVAETPQLQGVIPSSGLDLTPEGKLSNEQNAALTAAGRRWNEMKYLVNAAQNGDLFDGLDKALGSIDTWTSDQMLRDNMAIMRVANKFDEEGEKSLTDNERALLDALALNVAVSEMYGDEISNWYKGGEMIGEMVPFIIEMLMNPLAGLGKKAADKVTRKAIEKYGKELVKKNAKKFALTRGAAKLGASVAGATGMALTTGLPAVGADIQKRMLGDATYGYDDEGNIEYTGHVGGEDLGTSAYEAVTSRMLDNVSEMLGAGYANLPLKWLQKAGKGTKLLGWIDNLANSKFGKGVSRFAEKTKWNGPIEEFLEEVHVGLINPLLVGDQSWEEFFTKDNLATIAIGVAVPGAAISTANTIAGAVDGAFKVGAQERWKMQNAEAMGYQLWQDNPNGWNDLTRSLMVGQMEDVEKTLKEVYNNPQLSPEQKKVALEYAVYSLQWRTAKGVEEAFNEGKKFIDPMLRDIYGTAYAEKVSPVQANNAYKAMAEAEKKAQRVLGIGEESVDEWLNGRSAEEATNDAALQEAIKAYQAAKLDFEGRRDRYIAEKERAYMESDRSIQVNDNNGMVYATQLKDEPVYITGGNVVLNEDGTIDVNNSSEVLHMKFPDGHVEMISPDKFTEVFTSDRTADLKAAKRAEIDAKWKAEFDTAEAQSVEQEKREAGVVFNMTDAQGEHRVEVVKEGKDFSNILLDGVPQKMSTKELNSWKQEAGIQSTENGVQSTDVVADNATDNGIPTESEANVAQTGDNVAPVAPVELPDVPDFFRLNGTNYEVASRNDDGSVDVMVNGKRETLPAGTDYSTHMPTDKKGEVQYEQMPVERTHEYFIQKVKDDEARAEMIEKRRKKAEAERKKFDKKPDPGIDPDAYEAKMTQWEADKKAAQAKVDYWNEVGKREAEITRSETREAVENIKPDVMKETADEFIANQLAGIKITPESFKRETGLSNAEQAQLVGVISNDGVSVERAAEIITENYDSELKALGFTGDVQDVRDIIISVLSQGTPRSYAKKGREAREAENMDQQRADAEAWAKGAFNMTLDELYLYEETILPRMMRDYEGFDENEYYSNLAENNGYDTTRESESIGRGGELLQGEQFVPAGGTPVVGQRNEGGAVSDDVQGGSQNGVAQEEAPVNEPVGNSDQLGSSEIPNNQSVAEGDAPGQNGVQSLTDRILDRTEEKRRIPLRERAKELEAQVGVKANIIESVDEVADPEARRRIVAGQNVAGWYSKGQVYLYMPNIKNRREIELTYVHEVVAHHGVKKLLGKRFNEFLDGVWNMMSEADRARMLAYVGANENPTLQDMRAAADEYVAELAEKMNLGELEQSTWEKIVDWFKELLENIGFENLTKDDIESMLKASYANLRSTEQRAESTGTQFRIAEVNERFNNELQQQIDGTLPEGHIYELGMPSEILRATGIPELPIQLSSKKLKEKSTEYGHDYNLEEVKDLVKALNEPLAIFAYGDKTKAQNIVVEIQSNDKNFVVGLALRPKVGGRVLEINSIRNVFPKDNAEWLNWISQGKALYLDKERVQTLIDQQRTNLADVDYLDLNSIANVINNFENPTVESENSSENPQNAESGIRFRTRPMTKEEARQMVRELVVPFAKELREEQETRFRKGNRTLLGTHSVTEDKLRKAIRMGGLANPSTAVFELGEEIPGEYGEITFVMPSSMVDKKTGRNTGAFAGDAWTPTYPQVERQMGKRGSARAREDVQSVPKEMQKEVRMGLDSWLDGREGAGLAYLFLQEEGLAPELSRVAQMYSDETRNRVSEIAQGEPFYRLSPEQKQEIVDLFIEQYYNGDKAYYSNYLNEKLAMMQEKLADVNAKSFIKRSIQQYIDGVNEYGFDYEAVSNFLNKVQRDIDHSGGVNDRATTLEAARVIREKGLEREFQMWKEELLDRYEIKEVIFKGFTPTGNRRYVPHTLENVSKDMKEQGRNGAVGLNASFNKFAAGLLKPLGSLDAIRKRKGNLRATHADTEAFKDKWSEVYYGLAEKLQPDAKGYEDYGLDRVAEAAKKKDPKAFVKSEYGIELSEADEKALKDMVWAIQNEYPVMYFETKFERPVYLDEFAGVVIPENTGSDVVESLENAGLKIETYEPGNEKARVEAIKRLTEEDDRIMFRIANENQDIFVSNAQRAVEGIKQEKATPEQWIAMLKKNGGLKAGEEAWLGLEEWLNEKQGAVTKQEILDFIGENKIQIEEVNYTQFGYGLMDEATRKLEAELKEIGWDAMVEKYPGFDELFEVYEGELLWSEERASVGEYEDFIIDNKIIDLDSQSNAINETREKYTTDGLERKREIALTVPTVEPYNESDEVHFGDAGNGRAVGWVRFGETTDSEGNRVLVIDEIQSKRHQDGRKKGYKSQADKTPATMEELTFGEYNGLTTVSLRGERFFFKSSTSKDEILDIINKRIADGQLGAANSLVPDAPFEKNWHELAMKRMLRLAAEEGFDKVAWTTGEQQAERYNIGAVLKGLKAYKTSANEYYVIPYNNGAIGEFVKGYTEQELADTFGKELAQKIIANAENATEENPYEIEGEELRVGGEGMKDFYDRMLPSFVSKYTKKWGAKVGEVTMPDLRENNTMWSVDVTPEMQESVMQGQTMFRMGSRVDARMAEVAAHFEGKQLTAEQQAVVDVFGGKADNLTISVKTKEGNERRVVMRQGNEMGAGAKHSLFRHFGMNNGAITADDILLIPEILANGERVEKKRGKKTVIEYKYTDNNGVEYTVITENNKGREEFANFYTNRKASSAARKTRSEEARDTADDASADKGSDNSSNTQEGEARFRTVEETTDGSIDDVPTQPLTLMERITNSLLEVSAKNKENLELRTSALRTFGRDINRVLSLMKAQREYDKSTVDTLVKLAKMYFQNAQLLGEVTPYEVARIMGVLNRSVGKRDISTEAAKLMDILLDAHANALAGILDKAEKVKAKKVNAAGVEVMGRLDKYGQKMVDEYRAAKEMTPEKLEEAIFDSDNRLAELEQRVREVLGIPDGDVDLAAREYTGDNDVVNVYMDERARLEGLTLAREYKESIQQVQEEIKDLKAELKQAEEDYRLGNIDGKSLKEFRKSVAEAIMESKAELIEGYHSFIYKFQENTKESSQRAKEFAQAQIDRAREVQHNANSDMEGIPADTQGTHPDNHNNAVMNALRSPFPTFQGMLKKFGEKNVEGKGYLYERFMPQATKASDSEFRGKVAARVMIEAKLKEIYGKKANIARFMKELREYGATVTYREGNKMKQFDLTKGQMLYIYMVNKMADGQMKLRRMGITDDVVAELMVKLPEEAVLFADWAQNKLLKDLRGKYNAVHERVFGAPMAAIENYFPIKIRKEARGEKGDVSEVGQEGKPSTVTGSIIKRTKNATAIDLSADAMQVLMEHIDDMEHWAAFAEFNRDLNVLLNYKHFQNQVKNMTSVRYGSGEEMWKNFKRTAQIVSGTYRPSDSSIDRAVQNIAKGLTRSKINFRLYTAIKQLLSAPAFWTDAGVKELAYCYANPKGSFKWAKENLPGFAERWQGRTMGNEKLLKSDSDWDVWRNEFVEKATRWGMTPNAAIDALTVAQGARAVYMTKLEQFKKAGYTEQRANEKALQAAAEAYNESQQSSEGMYLSPLQVEGTVASAIFSTFKNSNFGYTRKTAQAVANIKRKMRKGYKEEAIAFMTKQMVRDGLSEADAKKMAEKVYNRSKYKDVANAAMFGFGLNLLWEAGGMAIYLLLGDDDEEKEKMMKEIALRGSLGLLNGVPFGETMISAAMAVKEGDTKYFRLPELVAVSDVKNLAQVLNYDPVRGANDIVNMLTSMGVGVTPQVLTDILVAFGDVEEFSAEELGMFVARFVNAPQSNLDRLMVDDAMENSAINADEIMRRYAEYKKSKNAPITQFLYLDAIEQKALERYMKRFNKMLDERLENVVEDNDAYDLFYKGADARMKSELAKMRQKYLAEDKAEVFEKMDNKELIPLIMRSTKKTDKDINEEYFNLSNAEDEDTVFVIKIVKKALEDLKNDGMQTDEEERLLRGLSQIDNVINKAKSMMEKQPDKAQEHMNNIRELRAKAIKLINNYRKDE